MPGGGGGGGPAPQPAPHILGLKQGRESCGRGREQGRDTAPPSYLRRLHTGYLLTRQAAAPLTSGPSLQQLWLCLLHRYDRQSQALHTRQWSNHSLLTTRIWASLYRNVNSVITVFRIDLPSVKLCGVGEPPGRVARGGLSAAEREARGIGQGRSSGDLFHCHYLLQTRCSRGCSTITSVIN